MDCTVRLLNETDHPGVAVVAGMDNSPEATCCRCGHKQPLRIGKKTGKDSKVQNSNIGELGRAFISLRTDAGIDFDVAWEQWQHIQRKLMFIISYPEVRCYDDRRIADSQERQRLRDLAQSELGGHKGFGGNACILHVGGLDGNRGMNLHLQVARQ